MSASLPLLAGSLATMVFACATLPMLLKAIRSRDLTSYSSGNLVLANVGNAFYSIYVFHLPPGPVWALHTFYVVSSALMLFWSRRYAPGRGHGQTHPSDHPDLGGSPEAGPRSASLA